MSRPHDDVGWSVVCADPESFARRGSNSDKVEVFVVVFIVVFMRVERKRGSKIALTAFRWRPMMAQHLPAR